MYLLDSSVAIEMVKQGKRSNAALNFLQDSEIAIPAFTVHEMLLGFDEDDEKWKNFITNINIMDYTSKCAEVSSRIDNELTKSGNKMGIFDMFIASIAIANKIKLVTFDNDFSRIKGLD